MNDDASSAASSNECQWGRSNKITDQLCNTRNACLLSEKQHRQRYIYIYIYGDRERQTLFVYRQIYTQRDRHIDIDRHTDIDRQMN